MGKRRPQDGIGLQPNNGAMLSQGGSWVSWHPAAPYTCPAWGPLHLLFLCLDWFPKILLSPKSLQRGKKSEMPSPMTLSKLPSPCPALPHSHHCVTLACFICSHGIYHCPTLQYTLTVFLPSRMSARESGELVSVFSYCSPSVSFMVSVVGRTMAFQRCPHLNPWNLSIGYVAKDN